MTKKKKEPDIYPPEFPDPLAPGGIPSVADGSEKPEAAPDPEGVARDAYLGELARDVAAGEAEPGEPLPEEEVAALGPGDVADLGAVGKVYHPLDALRDIVIGKLDPAAPVAGAAISFDPRGGKPRDAIAQRVSYVTDQGVVCIDLTWGDGNEATNVPYGDGPRTWKFRAE